MISKNKYLLAASTIILAAGVLFILSKSTSLISYIVPPGEVAKKEIKFLFVGDIMFDRGIRAYAAKYFDGDYARFFENVHTEIAAADIAFGNLEGPAALGGRRVGSIYSFRMDPKSLAAARNAGFDIFSVANNHAGDYASAAFEETLVNLAQNDIEFVGGGNILSEAEKPTIFELQGKKVGFLAFSDVGPVWLEVSSSTAGILLSRDPQNVARVVRQAKQMVDILVVSFHFGEEYQTHSNSRQQALARASIDAGAKIVVGHHPHVTQEIEEYHGGVIAYSLGNFIFDQAFSEDTKKSMMLEIILSPGGEPRVRTIPITFNSYFQPQILENIQ